MTVVTMVTIDLRVGWSQNDRHDRHHRHGIEAKLTDKPHSGIAVNDESEVVGAQNEHQPQVS